MAQPLQFYAATSRRPPVLSSADPQWISAKDLAAIAGISQQAANSALRHATWRGHQLIVQAVHARGGKSGTSYRVFLPSLPTELQRRWYEAHGETEFGALVVAEPAAVPAPVAAPGTEREWLWRFEIIRPAIGLSARSEERAAAIRTIAEQTHIAPDGSARRISESTVRNWLTAHERQALAGLRRAPRADRGKCRVRISREWDAVFGHSDAATDIVAKIGRDVRSLWAAGAPSWRQVARLAQPKLRELTRPFAAEFSESELWRLCRLPRAFVEKERPYRVIAEHDRDAKKFFDKRLPRIRRTREGMVPMEIVIGDVHHVDILSERADGSTFTPKMIAWHDVATNRVFTSVVCLEKREGIRQEHVIRSFIDMTQDPEWGVPQHLYLDNGGEYGWTDFVDDAMRLANMGMGVDYLSASGALTATVTRARRSMVIRARPYNAPAKPIEGIFAVLEGTVFSMLPGWIGGDRMRKKTQNVGKAPRTFIGDADELKAALAMALEYYHTGEQSGHLGGRSPREAFALAVESGWTRQPIDPNALEAIFAREEIRRVDRGSFNYGGEIYEHAALLPYSGHNIRVRVAMLGDKARITALTGDGKIICVARPKPKFAMLDPEGAKEQARLAAAMRGHINAAKREIDSVDLPERMAQVVAAHPSAPTPESEAPIRLTEEIEAIADARRDLPEGERLEREPDAIDLWRTFGRRSANSKAGGG